MSFSTEALLDACTLLFGQNISVSIDFINYLEPSGVKAAYRKRALETHPDRANVLGQYDVQMGERFKEITSAYQLLLSAVSDKRRIYSTSPRPTARPPQNRSPRTYHSVPNDFYHTGVLPNRKLKFGQYLFYSKSVSWKALIRAITWQR